MNVRKGEFMTRERETEREKKRERIMISNNNLFTLFKDKISSGGTNHSWKRLKILNPKYGMFLEQGRDYKLYIFLYRKHKRQYYYRPNFRQMHQD